MKKMYEEPIFDLFDLNFEDILKQNLRPSDPEVGAGDGDPGSGGDPF